MKNWLFAVVLALSTCVFAVPDEYPVSTPEELIAALAAHNADGTSKSVILLSPGDYNLTDATAMITNSSMGVSHLYIDRVTVRGTGDTPWATRLIGSGNLRIVYMNAGWLENVTITNGFAQKVANYSNSNRAGGVYGSTVTNCVIVGNKAQGVGGGAQGSTLRDCLVLNNESTGSGGGGGHNVSAYGCRFVCNKASSDGGGIYTAKELYDCRFISNVAGSNGNGGGVYGATLVSNCWFEGNSSAGGGGAYHRDGRAAMTLYDCVFTNNVSTGSGGAVLNGTLIGGTVIGNSANSGGGLSGCDAYDCTIAWNSSGGGGGASSCMLSNCTVRANVASNATATCYGGGVSHGTAIDCRIYGNAVFSCRNAEGTKTYAGVGGGVGSASSAVAIGCEIHDNYAESAGGGVGGTGVEVEHCCISNNIAEDNGFNTYSCRSIRFCDIEGGSLHGGKAYATTVHGVGREVALSGNPYFTETRTPGHVWHGYPNATNCLFYGNSFTTVGVLFSGVVNANTPSFLVNCTVVSNCVKYTFNAFSKPAYPMTVVNCVFANNLYLTGSSCDIHFDTSTVTAGALRISDSACGTTDPADMSGYVERNLYRFGVDGFGSSPRFCLDKDPEHPYSLRTGSPLRGRGQKADWMENATDIRGEGYARLRDDKVDIGCYQCWLDPVGMLLFVR